jgi:RNA polymerase sigma-70 factor (ECF subfamily)
MALFPFDDEYVRRLRDGDRVTVEHYVQYFKVLLTVMLHRRGVAPADIPDLIQDTHIRVLHQVQTGGIRDGHRFGALVTTTCRHVAQEYERKRHPTVEPDENLPSPKPSALDELVTDETTRRVRDVLEALSTDSPRDADILRDFFLNDLTKEEICRKYSVERDYLRVLIHRARRKFRDLYEDS